MRDFHALKKLEFPSPFNSLDGDTPVWNRLSTNRPMVGTVSNVHPGEFTISYCSNPEIQISDSGVIAIKSVSKDGALFGNDKEIRTTPETAFRGLNNLSQLKVGDVVVVGGALEGTSIQALYVQKLEHAN